MSDSRDELMGVAETFSQVARALADKGDVGETLNRIVHLAVSTLDSCEFAGISFVEGRNITSPASSDDVPKIVDAIQSEVDEGPCLDAIREHEVFQTGDLAAEDRWPRFAQRAFEETGIQSILSVRLFIEEDTMGSLNMYASAKDAFDDTDVALASVFAAHAAVAVSAATREQNLERKAATRDLIGRAKGILMAREHVTDDQAFDMLRRASQRLNVKLTSVAKQVATGEQSPESAIGSVGSGPDGSAVATDPAGSV